MEQQVKNGEMNLNSIAIDRANGSYPYEKSYNNKKSRAVRKESEDIQVLSEEQVDITLANIGDKINGDDQLPTKIQSFSTTEIVLALKRNNLSKDIMSMDIALKDIISKDIISKDIVSKDIDSKDIASKDIASQNIASQNIASQNIV
jgi:hypothetical protein